MTMKCGVKWSRIGRFVSCHLPGVRREEGRGGEVSPIIASYTRPARRKRIRPARVLAPLAQMDGGKPRWGREGRVADRSESSSRRSGFLSRGPTYNTKLTWLRPVVYTRTWLLLSTGCRVLEMSYFREWIGGIGGEREKKKKLKNEKRRRENIVSGYGRRKILSVTPHAHPSLLLLLPSPPPLSHGTAEQQGSKWAALLRGLR